MTRPGNQAPIRVLGVVLFAIAALLLTSIGGLGIVAAPVTLPLLFLVVRAHPTRAFRTAGALIGGITAAELGWALLYAVGGEVPVAIWLVPILCGVAAAVAFTTLTQDEQGRA